MNIFSTPYPTISLNIALSITPPIHHSTNPSLHQSITPPIHHSTNPSLHQSITPPIHHSTNPSLHQSNPLMQSSKISHFPRAIREELNRRLDRSEKTKPILQW